LTTSSEQKGISDVPTQIFIDFIKSLEESGAAPELIIRLRKALLEDKNYSQRILKAAVLGEEPSP